MKQFLSKLMSNPAVEGFKEIARWGALFAASWLVTQTLGQLDLVPEKATVQVWVFSYTLPVRLALQAALTFAGRWLDKFLFVQSKENIAEAPKKVAADMEPKGLLPF